jgi:ubiquinone/menaquinone biosynthesis C-methylase UbiE
MAPRNAVREQYSGLAQIYDTRWARYIDGSVSETLRRLPIAPHARVLDVGCGTGVLLSAIHAHHPTVTVVGADLTESMLRLAAARLPASPPLVVADVAHLPFRASSFDAVVSTSAFHYWPDPLGGLREIARVLRQGGDLVLTDWCDDYVACWLCDRVLRILDKAHRRAYGRRECRQFLQAAGFGVDRVDRYRITWFWGLMTACAFREGAPEKAASQSVRPGLVSTPA